MAPSSGWNLAFVLLVLPLACAACGIGRLEVMERVARVQLIGVGLESLHRAKPGTAITMECLGRCRKTSTCRGIFIDYSKSECKALTNSSTVEPTAKYRHTPSHPTAYFQKICIKAPPACAKSQWALERIPGYEVEAHDNRVMDNVLSREKCAEMCLGEEACRSAEYDERDKICKLSAENRRSQPLSFHPAPQHIHYMENQCISEPRSRVECEFEEFEDQDIGSWDVEEKASSQDECVDRCRMSAGFRCRGVIWQQQTKKCLLSADDVSGAGGLSSLRTAKGMSFLQKTPCLDLELECSTNSMTVNLHTAEPFQGRLFSQDSPSSCQEPGTGRTDTHLTINFLSRECGVVDEGNGVVSSVVVVQHHPVVQRRGDKAIKLVCLFNTANKTVSSGYNFQFSGHGLSGGVASAVVNATAPVPRLRLRIVGTDGRDVKGARLGEKLLLRLELDDDSVYGIMARNLVARSSDSTGEIVLLDEEGCPVDPLIFPNLKPLDKGSRGLQGAFQAFKFSDDSVVRFQVNVQFCLQECKPAQCGASGGGVSYGRKKRSFLVRNKRRGTIISPTLTLKDGDTRKLSTKYGHVSEEDPLYHEMPLQKEIIVNTRVEPLKDGVYPKEEELERLSKLVCTSIEVVACMIVAVIILMICLVLVTIMCVYTRRRRGSSIKSCDSSSNSSSARMGSSAALYRTPPSVDSAQTLRTLRSNYRD